MYLLLEQYNPAWKTEFEKLKSELLQTLHGLHVTIEHVGSTAVPNMDAKPIIDIDIIYVDGSEFKKIKEKLESVGYSHNGNQGITNVKYLKEMANIPMKSSTQLSIIYTPARLKAKLWNGICYQEIF
jgi:GrpB-like predicted nucleotidyltransferase (UPF0157 family)